MCTSAEETLNYFDENLPLVGMNGNHLKNLLDLSSDMKGLLESNLMTDIAVCINGKEEMYCHKDILKFRSKWFYNAVCKADTKGVSVIEVNDDSRVMEAVLCYMYTGDLRLLEPLNIYLAEVYEAAEKYGFSRLKEILKRMLQECKYDEIMKHTQFQWVVKVVDGIVLDTDCPHLNSFSICGNDKWKMKAKSINSPDDSDDYSIAFYLERQTEESSTTIHDVKIIIHVTDNNGKNRHCLSEKHDFLADGEYRLHEYIPLTKLIKERDDLISDGMLTLTCELTFLARVNFLTKFRLAGSYRRYISNELVHLSEDMFNVFRDGKTQDISFGRSHVKMHYYILHTRSCIPKDFVPKLEKAFGFRKLLWVSFASFLYTGQSRFLDEHARTVYWALSETELLEARRRYSNFLARNLTFENAFCILNDAVFYKDDSLSLAAANYLANKLQLESDPQAWIQIAADKRKMLEFISQSYAFKQFL